MLTKEEIFAACIECINDKFSLLDDYSWNWDGHELFEEEDWDENLDKLMSVVNGPIETIRKELLAIKNPYDGDEDAPEEEWEIPVVEYKY